MASLSKAFSYLIAAQTQAVALILMAYWGGEWLNDHHPIGLNWFYVTFTVAVIGIFQTFYVVIRAAFTLDRDHSEAATGTIKKKEDGHSTDHHSQGS